MFLIRYSDMINVKGFIHKLFSKCKNNNINMNINGTVLQDTKRKFEFCYFSGFSTPLHGECIHIIKFNTANPTVSMAPIL
jgi:hypothetical protein